MRAAYTRIARQKSNTRRRFYYDVLTFYTTCFPRSLGQGIEPGVPTHEGSGAHIIPWRRRAIFNHGPYGRARRNPTNAHVRNFRRYASEPASVYKWLVWFESKLPFPRGACNRRITGPSHARNNARRSRLHRRKAVEFRTSRGYERAVT